VNNRIIQLKSILWILVSFGFVAIIARIFGGLGASTNLSDSMPWGLWKILNMVAGAALATGGFTLAAVVHVFKIEKYKPFMRPAILIAFLGYGSSLFALLWDIGLPHVFYNPFFYWNHHSFLFEVFWCVSLYFLITTLELAPIIFEKYNTEKLVKWLHRISTPVIILGITFSTLHHTSLGSLFLTMPTRLHALWFTNWIPVLFFLSAVGGGIMMVVLVELCYSYFYEKENNKKLSLNLAKIATTILSLYFVVKIIDLIYHGNFYLLFSGQWESYVFMFELLISVIIPVTIVLVPKLRSKTSGLGTASVCAVAGLAMNRIDVGITGLLRTSETGYFPSFLELSLSLGVIAGALIVYIYILENFEIFPDSHKNNLLNYAMSLRTDRFSGIWSRSYLTGFARISFFVVIALSLSSGIFYGSVSDGLHLAESAVNPPRGFDKVRTVLLIDGDHDNDFVKFNHESHKEKLGQKESCILCHHLDLPNDNASACWKCHQDMNRQISIFKHSFHQEKLKGKYSCTECHKSNQAKNLENSKKCEDCHKEDMNNICNTDKGFSFMALSYKDAMHKLCISCHKKEEERLTNIKLSECKHCHQESWKNKYIANNRYFEDKDPLVFMKD